MTLGRRKSWTTARLTRPVCYDTFSDDRSAVSYGSVRGTVIEARRKPDRSVRSKAACRAVPQFPEPKIPFICRLRNSRREVSRRDMLALCGPHQPKSDYKLPKVVCMNSSRRLYGLCNQCDSRGAGTGSGHG